MEIDDLVKKKFHVFRDVGKITKEMQEEELLITVDRNLLFMPLSAPPSSPVQMLMRADNVTVHPKTHCSLLVTQTTQKSLFKHSAKALVLFDDTDKASEFEEYILFL